MKRTSGSARAFRPLMDWWVIVLVLVIIAMLSATIPLLFTITNSKALSGIALVIVVLTVAYIADSGFFSYYLLEDEGMSVISNVRHAYFPYRDMTEIKPANAFGLVSFGTKKRFALSSRCFLISLRRGYWKSITVSPAERDLFLNTLISHIDRERSSRATFERKKK